jgi:hypothetical protein
MKKLILISALLFSLKTFPDIQDDSHQTIYEIFLSVALTADPRSLADTMGRELTVIACDVPTVVTTSITEDVIPSSSVLSLLFAYTDISLFMKLPLIGQDWRFISQIKNEGDEWSDVFDDHLNSHFGTPKINVRFDDDALAIAVNMAPPEEIKPFGPQDEMRQISEEFIIDINRNTGSIFLRQTNEMEFNPNLFPPSQISLLPRAQIYITGSSTCSLVGEKKF